MLRFPRAVCLVIIADAVGLLLGRCLGQQTVHPLPQAFPGTSYAAQLAIPPGLGYPFAQCELLGQAPRWLDIDCTRLQLKGKVPAAKGDSSYEVTLRIQDNAGNSRSYPLSLRVSASPQVVSLAEPAVSPSQDKMADTAGALPLHRGRLIRMEPAVTTESDSDQQDSRSSPASREATKAEQPEALATQLAESVAALRPAPIGVPENRGSIGPGPHADESAAGQPTTPSAGTAKKPVITSTSLIPGSTVISGTGTAGTKISIPRNSGDLGEVDVDREGLWSVAVPSSAPLSAGETLTAHQSDHAISDPVNVQPKLRLGDDMHAILGFQQTGASSASSNQQFFFDFYINRPIISTRFRFGCQAGDLTVDGYSSQDPKPECEQHFHWWGNVRVASYPQTISAPVGTFVASFDSEITNVPVNKLAQAAEFLTGLEYILKSSSYPVVGRNEDSRQRYSLGLFAGFGATSPLDSTDPGNFNIYYTPPSGSPQLPLFQKEYPGVTSTYIAFTPPDHNLFYSQYLAGVRYTTHFADQQTGAPFSSPPALVSIAMGQNEQVTQGLLRGVVARFDAFYPLPLTGRRGNSSPWQAFDGIYLFGSAQLRIARPSVKSPLILQTAPTDVHGYDSDVTVYPIRTNRDLYMIGVGVDTVQVVSSIVNGRKPKT